MHALEDVLPLSSRYLMSSTSAVQQKPDAATLAAENHILHDAIEQQHFKLKVRVTSFVFCSHMTVLTSMARLSFFFFWGGGTEDAGCGND